MTILRVFSFLQDLRKETLIGFAGMSECLRRDTRYAPSVFDSDSLTEQLYTLPENIFEKKMKKKTSIEVSKRRRVLT